MEKLWIHLTWGFNPWDKHQILKSIVHNELFPDDIKFHRLAGYQSLNYFLQNGDH